MRAEGRSRGFSLLELIVVVAMIGLLAALSFSSLARSSAEGRLRSAEADLVTRLLLRRAEALKGGSTLGVEFRAEGATVRLLPLREDGPTREWTLAGEDAQLSLETAESDEPTSDARFAFLPTGRATTRSFSVRDASAGGTILTIHFDPISGEPRAEPPAEARAGTEQGGDP